ncbi:MAG: LysR family transcriptional regulator [Bdellovibrio sp.]|nr:LysR family transcriptional regulator [Bdellovibrio sp.]
MISQTDLKYFLEISKTLHVSRAAERLGVTQPTLSHCLKRIELEAKTQLFIRSKKGLTLTQAGRRLADHAVELIQKWDEVLLSAQNEVQKVSGLIRFGCHTAVAQYTLPYFVSEFLHKFPEINFSFAHGLSRHMTEDVISQKLDAAFVINPVAHPDLIIKEISKDRGTLWKSKNCLNSDVLIVEPSLLQTQEIIKKMQKKDFHFKRIVESPSLEVIAQLMISGVGCGVLPERVIKALTDDTIQPVKNAPEFHDRMCLIYKSEFRKSARGQALIEMVNKKLVEAK